MFDNSQDPVVFSPFNRMINHSVGEEGIIDLFEGTATNKLTRRCTANMLSNTQKVENFIHAKIRANPEVASPSLYNYYFDSNYATQN